MKKLSLENLKLEATDLLQRSQLKSIFGGYGINPYCCWDYAGYEMNTYLSDPETPYLTPSEENDLWSYYYDGCNDGGYIGCLPAN